jgi:chromosome segregation ATPase
MTEALAISLAGIIGAVLTKGVDYLISKRTSSKQCETADKQLELDWQKEFNAATAAFRGELQETIKELRNEVSDLRDDVDKLRSEKSNLEEEVTRLRSKNETLNEEVVKLNRQNASLKSENDQLERRVQELERQNGGKSNVGN